MSSRVSNLRVAALIAKRTGSAVEGGLESSTFAISRRWPLVFFVVDFNEKGELLRQKLKFIVQGAGLRAQTLNFAHRVFETKKTPSSVVGWVSTVKNVIHSSSSRWINFVQN